MTKITLNIKSCNECPKFNCKRAYSADSFEYMHDWFCGAENNKIISEWVGWNEEDSVKIPTWCPLK